jgi:hypothetical protein
MEIEYSLTEEDILALTELQFQRVPAYRGRMRMLRLGYPILFTLVSIGYWFLFKDWRISIAFFTFGLFAYLVYPAYTRMRMRQRIRRDYQKDQKLRKTLGKRKLVATSEGLQETSSLGKIKVKWKQVSDIEVTADNTFISVKDIPSIIIPKTQIQDEEAYHRFVATCMSFWRGEEKASVAQA